MNNDNVFHAFLDAPTSGVIVHDNKVKHYRNETVNFTAEFETPFPPWDSITWKINKEFLNETLFFNVTKKQFKFLHLFNIHKILVILDNRLTSHLYLIYYIIYYKL